MKTIPTCVMPARGWRFWALWSHPRWEASVDMLQLAPVYGGALWPPRSAPSARRYKPHRSPVKACDCGYYAFAVDAPLRNLVLEPIMSPPSVLGTVLGWGRVVEHEHGWRAQLAYPASIGLFCSECFRVDLKVVKPTIFWSQFLWKFALCDEHSEAREKRLASDARRRWKTCSAEAVETMLLAKYGVEHYSIESRGNE